MKKKIIWASVIAFLILEILIGINIKPDMSSIGEARHKFHSIAGHELPFGGINVPTMYVTWGVMAFIIILALLAMRNVKLVPGRLQLVFEMFVGAFDKLCSDTLGERGRKFMPLVASLFIFICLCNWVGLIPLGWEEPTSDLNTTLGLGIICFFVSHGAAIRYKGIKKYILDYFEPMIEIKGVKIPNVVFMPLNVVGEIGKLISHSFRLYGNILGGAIIMQVVSNLVRYIALPVGLNLFFGLFVGAVQAFVFSMLALTYVSVLVE
ncbi:MAG: F0F1 ATP synthase subunit A [Candidatus Omnitrophica bacterium]|nr:F0F1 ATP synthase subunit A [Candidatus Omnitrophota bacterium]